MKTYKKDNEKREKILEFLEKNPCSTLREVQKFMGFSSHTVALYHIKKLQECMKVTKNNKRGYTVPSGAEPLEMQINKLAFFLMENYSDKFNLMPPKGESAVDFAIRLLSKEPHLTITATIK